MYKGYARKAVNFIKFIQWYFNYTLMYTQTNYINLVKNAFRRKFTLILIT